MRSELGAIAIAVALAACSKARDEHTLGVRNAHAMAYDGARHQVILFGGADELAVRNDTWGWNGRKWHLLATGGPPPRTFPVMAYDGAKKRVLLFGGNRVLFGADPAAETLLGDLWSWDGRRWTRLADASSGPGPRAEACGAFDESRGRFVVFGGYGKTGATRHRMGDTWEWDGASWTLVADDGPSARSGAAMTYVPARENRGAGVVVFGGSTGKPPPQHDTWHWDGHRWSLLFAGSTAGRFNAAMTYDSARNAVVRFGGWTGVTRVAELWRLAVDGWTLVDNSGPAARNHTAWVYDEGHRNLVLYGGHDGERVFGDTWTWDGSLWREAMQTPPRMRIDNGH